MYSGVVGSLQNLPDAFKLQVHPENSENESSFDSVKVLEERLIGKIRSKQNSELKKFSQLITKNQKRRTIVSIMESLA